MDVGGPGLLLDALYRSGTHANFEVGLFPEVEIRQIMDFSIRSSRGPIFKALQMIDSLASSGLAMRKGRSTPFQGHAGDHVPEVVYASALVWS